MAKEKKSLGNKTCTVRSLPPGKTPSKWVYRVKYHFNGSIDRCKTRLVIRGDEQVDDFDYNETFAPIAKMVSVRCLLAIAVAKGWDLHQMDIHNAFLHGDLEEDVHMKMPRDFKSLYPNNVWQLCKSLYGLR